MNNKIQILIDLTKRDVYSKYKGSNFGLLWSFLNPLFMLAVYTFAFGIIFKSKWANSDHGILGFGLVIFPGLIVFNLISECTNRSTEIIKNNVSYVKKIIFRLEYFPEMLVLSALFHFLISLIVWIIFFLCVGGPGFEGLIFVPIILIPLLCFALGASYFVSAISVYVNDIKQIVSLAMGALIFISPVFYSSKDLPDNLKWVEYINPVAPFVELIRNVLVFEITPTTYDVLQINLIGIITLIVGYGTFQVLKEGYADVV